MRQAEPGERWLSALPGLKLRAWPGEDEAAVWAPGSLNTHLVSALAAEVLVAAQRGHCSVESITATLLAGGTDADRIADPVPGDEAAATVATVVAGLVQAGLLRQVAAIGRG